MQELGGAGGARAAGFGAGTGAAGQEGATVQVGESSLAQLASRLGQSLQSLIQANPQLDPNNIKPGQEVRLPAAGTQAFGKPPSTSDEVPPPMFGHAGGTQMSDPLPKAEFYFRQGGASASPVKMSQPRQPLEDLLSPNDVQFYRSRPDGTQGAGAPAAENWLRRMADLLPKLDQAKSKLQDAVRDYDATAAKDGERLDAAMKKDIPKGVAELDKKTNGEVSHLMEGYQKERYEAHKSLQEETVATHEHDAALAEVGIADKDIQKHEAQLTKKEEEGKKADLEKQIAEAEKVAGMITDTVGSATGVKSAEDLTGLMKSGALDLGKLMLSDYLSADARKELMQVNARIGALDDKINALGKDQDKSKLEALKSKEQAAAAKILIADNAYRHHTKQADGKLDQLVRKEQEYGTTTVFHAMRDYNTDMTVKGKQVFDAANQYLGLANSKTLKDGPAIYAMVEADKQYVGKNVRDGDEKSKFMQVAGSVQDYESKVETWAKNESGANKAIGTARDNLAAGKHLEVVDRAMDAVARGDRPNLAPSEGYMKRTWTP